MASKKEPKSPDPTGTSPVGRIHWMYFVLSILVIWFLFFAQHTTLHEISWKQFEEKMLVKGDVAKLDVVNNERVEVYIKEEKFDTPEYKSLPKEFLTKKTTSGPHYFFNIGSAEVFHKELEEAQKSMPKEERVAVTYSKRSDWSTNILSWLLPLGLLFLFWMFLMPGMFSRMKGMGGSIFNFGQSKARMLEKGEKSQVTFADVAGLEEAKEEIFELIKFLKTPGRYKNLGAKMPKGILLVGPPGTGKTLLAKAVAGEADVPFFSLSGSEFIEMFVGVGAARMRDLFQKAKARAPSIIFIDEIDTIGRARGKIQAFQANDERESTLNQLLAELDGFDTGTGVIVLAATNRGDILDPALLRPGRFDRHVHLELPNLTEREAIFGVHMLPIKLADDVDEEMLAANTPGFSGADIANICNEAALIAARRDREAVFREDFMDAIDRIVGGMEKRNKIIRPDEKKRVAYHEAGHVVAGWFLEHPQPVLKVSIIPRGRSLGAAWYLPEEHQIITRSQFIDAIKMALGGRAAEELVFDEVSSNALDDLEKITKQAYAMVASYGLGSKIHNLSYYDSSGRTEHSFHKPYSEKTAEKIDEEVQQIVDLAYVETIETLSVHKRELDELAERLIEKEVIHKEEIEKILGKMTNLVDDQNF